MAHVRRQLAPMGGRSLGAVSRNLASTCSNGPRSARRIPTDVPTGGGLFHAFSRPALDGIRQDMPILFESWPTLSTARVEGAISTCGAYEARPLHTGFPSGPLTCCHLCSINLTTFSGIGT